MMRTGWWMVALAAGVGCSSEEPTAPPPPATTTSTTSAGGSGGGGAGGAGGSLPAVPTIDEALDCGTPASAGGLAPGSDMARHDLDLAQFPEAMCNDGTPGFFYYRGPETAAGEGRWVIQLQGGGGCRDAASCLNRWCSVDTNFGMTQMTGTASPQAIDGKGILARRPDNPLADAHHVFVRYCSSDSWQGRRSEVVLDGEHPVSGEPVQARVHFQGSAIVEAVLETLRAERGLDEATSVLLAGASAGGAGVITHSDAVADNLRARNPDVTLRVLHDSNFTPANELLDYSTSTFCSEDGLCDWASHYTYEHTEGTRVFRDALLDQSCLDFHKPSGDGWKCVDVTHVQRHHLTTPMMVRMSQADSLLSKNIVDRGFGYDGELLDAAGFAAAIRAEAAALADATTTAEEGANLEASPALFVPTCPKHETLGSTADTFDVAIDVEGTATRMFDVFAAWAGGGMPRVVIASDPGDDQCP